MNIMKSVFLSLLAFCISFAVQGYDLNNKALTPVTHKKAPNHAPVKLVENGELRFAIAVDESAEFNRKAKKCFTRSANSLASAFERCTGKRPPVISIADAGKYPFVIYVGASKEARKAGIDPMKLPEQGFIIQTFSKGVYIVGHDSSVDPNYKKGHLVQRTEHQRESPVCS